MGGQEGHPTQGAGGGSKGLLKSSLLGPGRGTFSHVQEGATWTSSSPGREEWPVHCTWSEWVNQWVEVSGGPRRSVRDGRGQLRSWIGLWLWG